MTTLLSGSCGQIWGCHVSHFLSHFNILLASINLVLWDETLIPPVASLQTLPAPLSGEEADRTDGFSEERAWEHLEALSELGPKPTGSHANEARAYFILRFTMCAQFSTEIFSEPVTDTVFEIY